VIASEGKQSKSEGKQSKSEAKLSKSDGAVLDCLVATLFAMTALIRLQPELLQSRAGGIRCVTF
jgi:hypothetical protein